MTPSKSSSFQPWRRLLTALLVLAMMITPLVSVMAELHESEHVTLDDHNLNTPADHDIHTNAAPSSDTDESGLHFLAHASHCCGHIVALLPDALHLVLMSAQSVPSIKREHSLTGVLRISHFRPPIFL